jgi:small subunit ribosomal protein S8
MSTTTTDPIADMLSRIRNAIAVNKVEVSMPHSDIKQRIAQLLVENNFLSSTEVFGSDHKKQLAIKINMPNQNAVINEIVRLSRPGKRLYSTADNIPTVKRGRGLVIISTSQGLMTGEQAKISKLGGELICKVY